MDDLGMARDTVEQAVRALARSTHAVALVGNLSPTTRHAKTPASGLTYRQFQKDPGDFWQRNLGHPEDTGMLTLSHAAPGAAREALGLMQAAGAIQHVLTQETDGLLFVAGCTAVTEVHGSLRKVRCIQCATRFDIGAVPMAALPPLCPQCGGLLKPDALLAGEPITADALAACKAQTSQCDAMLLINAVGLTYPLANLPLTAHRRGAWVMEISEVETPAAQFCDSVVRAPAGKVLPMLLKGVIELRSTRLATPAG